MQLLLCPGCFQPHQVQSRCSPGAGALLAQLCVVVQAHGPAVSAGGDELSQGEAARLGQGVAPARAGAPMVRYLQVHVGRYSRGVVLPGSVGGGSCKDGCSSTSRGSRVYVLVGASRRGLCCQAAVCHAGTGSTGTGSAGSSPAGPACGRIVTVPCGSVQLPESRRLSIWQCRWSEVTSEAV